MLQLFEICYRTFGETKWTKIFFEALFGSMYKSKNIIPTVRFGGGRIMVLAESKLSKGKWSPVCT